MVSAPLGGGAEHTDGSRLAARGLRFSKAAVERLREDRGRARPSVEANLGAFMEGVLSEPLPASDDPPHSYRGSDISSGTLVNMEAEEVPFL